MAFVVPITAGSDWHCGWEYIPDGVIVRIIENRQSVCFGTFAVDGTLLLEGSLILEA